MDHIQELILIFPWEGGSEEDNAWTAELLHEQ